MEVPLMEDSMEMASPYMGQADDFDIDIDLMDDHASNMDSDMMGADEFSQPQEPNNDAIFDADMVDEPSEGSMVDVDNYVAEDHDIDVQSQGEPYEAEMTEGDQVEDVVAPEIAVTHVPTLENAIEQSNEDVPAPIEQAEPAMVEQVSHTLPETQDGRIEPTPVPTEVPAPEAESQTEDADKNEDNQAEPGTPEEDDDLAEPPTETLDFGQIHNAPQQEEPSEKANDAIKSDAAATDAIKENVAVSEDQVPIETSEDSQQVEKQSGPEVDHHDEGETQNIHHEVLHPVKIIYQENEIALFPPFEGDSAETFFLQDEDVAYESFSQLFKALRQVLQGNVAENEVLIIDIDTLGIQMTEDSSHTSQVTLHQIVDIYLRLSRNDGANHPDALYLTLSSKRAFPAEIADLLDAANDGKTLSEIHSWDEYDEGEPGSEDDHTHGVEEHEDEAYYITEAEQKLSIPEDQSASKPEDEKVPIDDDLPTQQQHSDEAKPEDSNLPAKDEANISVPEVEAATEAQPFSVQFEANEINEQNQPQQTDPDHDDLYEDHYESEGPHSESTTTVAAAPGETDAQEEYTHDDQLGQVDDTSTEQHDENVHEDDHDYDDLGPDEYFEDEDVGFVNNSETSQEGRDSSHAGTGDAQQPIEKEPVSEEQDEDGLGTPPSAAPTSVGLLPDEANPNLPEQTTSTLESETKDVSDNKEQTPEPTDDLLGIAVDLMQTPAKDSEHDALDQLEGLDDEYDENDPSAAAPIGGPDADNDEFDENEFGDYDTNFEETEGVEFGETDPSFAESQSHDNASTKRSREEEEDWDVEDTTLEAKRRRPS
ncbi:hypothetical protein MYU51_015321 [Penicillium brevicompactum]